VVDEHVAAPYGQALVQAPEANKYPLIQVVDAVDVQTAVLPEQAKHVFEEVK
jgi:hypothetical protein